jgi:protein-tyrosine-phosphatase
MAHRPYSVLFLCTGNSARSIIAEALINQWGRGKFRGFSAGSHPKGTVHPIALQLLQRMNLRTAGLRSKSWEEFATPGAAPLDFVFTVCDNAAGEVCPSLVRRRRSDNGTTVRRGRLTEPGAVTRSEGFYAVLESRCRYSAAGGCGGGLGRAADSDGVGRPA